MRIIPDLREWSPHQGRFCRAEGREVANGGFTTKAVGGGGMAGRDNDNGGDMGS